MEPFIGQITMVGFNYAPQGWALCNGQTLPISQNQALFSLLGTYYGGDGRTTFALPDLRGRAPVHQGQGHGSHYSMGQQGGREEETMSTPQMPAHNHPIQITEANIEAHVGEGRGESADSKTPDGSLLGNPTESIYYKDKGPNVSLSNSAISVEAQSGNTGESQPVSKMQPYTTVNFIIALQGLYPPRS